MRKIFGGAMLASAVGSVVLGGALAWNASVTLDGVLPVDVGDLSFTATWTQADDGTLGPNGATATVGTFGVSNDGDFNLGWESGLVVPLNLDASHASCDVANFTGIVSPIGEINTAQGVAPGTDSDPAGRVEITVASGAPVACAGGQLTFDVIVTLKTLPNAP